MGVLYIAGNAWFSFYIHDLDNKIQATQALKENFFLISAIDSTRMMDDIRTPQCEYKISQLPPGGRLQYWS